MAIGTITAVVFVMFLIVGPKKHQQQQPQFAGTNYVQVSSATWGINCNDNIEHKIELAQERRAKLPREKRDEIPIPKIVVHNNAITHLSKLCNGKETCSFLAESDVIGLDPVYSCYKRLQVNYRCFDIDRLRTIDVKQGDMVRMECAKSALEKLDAKKPDADKSAN